MGQNNDDNCRENMFRCISCQNWRPIQAGGDWGPCASPLNRDSMFKISSLDKDATLLTRDMNTCEDWVYRR
jgi:hypothetical protein